MCWLPTLQVGTFELVSPSSWWVLWLKSLPRPLAALGVAPALGGAAVPCSGALEAAGRAAVQRGMCPAGMLLLRDFCRPRCFRRLQPPSLTTTASGPSSGQPLGENQLNLVRTWWKWWEQVWGRKEMGLLLSPLTASLLTAPGADAQPVGEGSLGTWYFCFLVFSDLTVAPPPRRVAEGK